MKVEARPGRSKSSMAVSCRMLKKPLVASPEPKHMARAALLWPHPLSSLPLWCIFGVRVPTETPQNPLFSWPHASHGMASRGPSQQPWGSRNPKNTRSRFEFRAAREERHRRTDGGAHRVALLQGRLLGHRHLEISDPAAGPAASQELPTGGRGYADPEMDFHFWDPHFFFLLDLPS